MALEMIWKQDKVLILHKLVDTISIPDTPSHTPCEYQMHHHIHPINTRYTTTYTLVSGFKILRKKVLATSFIVVMAGHFLCIII